MMEAARTSETLVNFYQTTRRYNPEDSHLHTPRRENLKSYLERESKILCSKKFSLQLSIMVFWVVTPLTTFRRNVSSPSSGQKIKAINPSETLVTTCKTKQCHNPEDQNRHRPDDGGSKDL
jgi:hypothetical protein